MNILRGSINTFKTTHYLGSKANLDRTAFLYVSGLQSAGRSGLGVGGGGGLTRSTQGLCHQNHLQSYSWQQVIITWLVSLRLVAERSHRCRRSPRPWKRPRRSNLQLETTAPTLTQTCVALRSHVELVSEGVSRLKAQTGKCSMKTKQKKPITKKKERNCWQKSHAVEYLIMTDAFISRVHLMS